jgi:hypothetical protein
VKGKIASIIIFMLMLIPVFSAEQNGISWESPSTPTICGPCEAELEEPCCYSICSFDHQRDDIYYEIRYSDCPNAKITVGPIKSGVNLTIEHCWCCQYQTTNPFSIRIKAEDENGHESQWARFDVTISNTKTKFSVFQMLCSQLSNFFESHHYLLPLVRIIQNLIK